MWALQQKPDMKSLWHLALRLDSAVSPWTLCVTGTELLTFDSMLSCKLEGCLKIKYEYFSDKCVAFPHLSFRGCRLSLWDKSRAAGDIVWNSMRKICISEVSSAWWWRRVISLEIVLGNRKNKIPLKLNMTLSKNVICYLCFFLYKVKLEGWKTVLQNIVWI